MEDTGTVNSIIYALYDTISGPQGRARDWDCLRSLFLPDAHLVRTSLTQKGTVERAVMGIEDFIKAAAAHFQQISFFEAEIARRTDTFGNIAHVFSTYEARQNRDDAMPTARGINSIQLFNDGTRWWVVNMLWDDERENNPIPEKYLP